MVSVKLVPKRRTVPKRIRQWPPREPYQKFKIKTLKKKKKTVQIKKTGKVVRIVIVRRKTKKFTDRWARTF